MVFFKDVNENKHRHVVIIHIVKEHLEIFAGNLSLTISPRF